MENSEFGCKRRQIC